MVPAQLRRYSGIMGKLSTPLVCTAGALILVAASSCYVIRPSSGAGQTTARTHQNLAPEAVKLPAGYQIEVVASGLTFPVGAALDDGGRLHVVESGYSYGEDFTEPRLLRIEPDGRAVPIASGGKGGPWTGVVFHQGNFYVADGNVLEGGRLIRISMDGKIDALVTGLPSFGDHHTNGPAVGPDGWIYFTQGTATNSGIVGEDNFKFGWLKRRSDFHDVPGQDITLTGESFETDDVRNPGSGRKVRTGAFLPFGTPGQAGQVIKGAVKSSGSVLRVRLEGGEPELIAWGFRNPFGIAFAADGSLFVTDNGYDDRGSRPVWGTPDLLWKVQRGVWYGWPDYSGGEPLTDPAFQPPGKKPLKPLLLNPPNQPPKPVAKFPVHSSADGIEFSRSANFGHVGEAFVAIFGDEAPATGKMLSSIGGKVVRVNVSNGTITDFAVNRAPKEGPGTKVRVAGLERPVSVRFDRSGDTLYIVDFGVLRHDQQGAHPERQTGSIWRIRRQR
jgi:glucose/arabinose dehydrogenase